MNGDQRSPREGAARSKPALGILSLLFPVGMALAWSVFEGHPEFGNGMNGYAGLLIGVFLYIGTFLFCAAGLALGIAGLLHRERPWFLSLLGILVNVAVVFWVLTHR